MNLGCLSLEQRKELAANLRGSYRWSQQKIADAIGVDQKTVCNWLGGAAEAPHSYAYIVKYGVGSPILHRFTGVPDSTIKAAMVALGPTAREKRMLDGRNRLAACKLAGVKPRFIQYTGDSPVAFIVAANLKRRHLDKGQKIALALEIEPLFAEEARKRMAAGGGDHGNQYTGGKPGVGTKSHTR